MRPGAYSLTSICLLLACSAEARPFDNIFKSLNILGGQSPLRDYIMPPAGEVSSGVIISDVIGKTQDIAIFSGLTRDISAVAGRLDDGAQNATVLAPSNSVMRTLKRKPWEDPEGRIAPTRTSRISSRDTLFLRAPGKRERKSRLLLAMRSGGRQRMAKRR
jgi:hypothetical protein